jgi:predicted RNase H-like HicB family nuclease
MTRALNGVFAKISSLPPDEQDRIAAWLQVELASEEGLFVGYVPGWPSAHSRGASVDELRQNLEEVVAMLLEDGEPKLEGEFVGTQTVKVA